MQLRDAGFNMVVYANHLLRSAYPAMLSTAETILRNNRTKEAEASLISIKNLFGLIPANYD
jgi:phosphoenolpyruvate phosphomutase